MSDAPGVVPGLPIATSADEQRRRRPPTATASASATPCGRPEASSVDASIAAMTANAPWAKFTTRVTR